MSAALTKPLVGVLVAIAVTTIMDAAGLAMFSSFCLLPLIGVFWFRDRFARADIGLAWGRPAHYAPAVLYGPAVQGAAGLIAMIAGAVHVGGANWKKAGLNVLLVSASTIIAAILTEEGFFRGWLWASLARAGLGEARVLLWSSVAFSLWHLSSVSLKTGFELPAEQIPVFLVNAAVMGAIWGMLRLLSGSVVVASVSHGIWNGLAYVLFGYGTKVGALGITATSVFGPEVGILGLVLNAIFAWALWRRAKRLRPSAPSTGRV